MSVMLRCACSNEVTIPDQAAAGIVTCPVCHRAIDPKTSVIHPRLDDLDPELLLAPEDDQFANQTPASAVEFHRPSEPAIELDELPSLADEPEGSLLANAEPQPLLDDIELSTGDVASTLAAPTPMVVPPDDNDIGYEIAEDAPAAIAPSSQSLPEVTQSPHAESAEKPMEEPTLTAEPVKAPRNKPVNLPRPTMDDLLDDDIMLTPAEPVDKPSPLEPARCPECKTRIKPGSVLCVSCGYNFKLGTKTGSSAALGKPQEKKRDKSLDTPGSGDFKKILKDPRVLMGAGGLAVVLVLVAGAYLFLGSDKKPPASPSTATAAATPPTPGTPPATPVVPITPGASSPNPAAESVPATGEIDPAAARLLIAPTIGGGRAASLAFSADAKLLALGDESGNIPIWDFEKSEARPPLATGVTGAVQVAFDRDGKQLLAGFSGGAKLWDIAAGTDRSFKSPVDGLFAVRFAGDGKSLITSGPTGLLSTVDLAANGRVKPTKIDELPINAYPVVDVTADGKTAIFGSDDGLLLVWDVAAGKPLKHLEGHTTKIAAVAISADGSHALSAAGGAEYRMVGKERRLASSRPNDYTVRLWDLASGKEVFRIRTSPTLPVTCVGFSPDSKSGLIVAGDVQVFDIGTKQRVATISPAPPGSAYVANTPNTPQPPTEPFRLAVFSPDGKRLATTCMNSGVHVWELPLRPSLTPLAGITNPPDLATFSPTATTPIPPLVLKTVSRGNDPGSSESIAAKAAKVSAEKNATIKALQKALTSQPRTAEYLLKLAKLCAKKQLELEAEECLRAVLMADPVNKEAQQLYDELKLVGSGGSGPVTLDRGWAKPIPTLEDAGLQPEPHKNESYCGVPIDVSVIDKFTKINADTITAKAGEKEAKFIGIHHRATGEIQGAKKGSSPAAGQLQVWEEMLVGNKNGKRSVLFQNRRIPQAAQPRAGRQPAAAANGPKVTLVGDKTSVKEDYKGPYEAIFSVPEGETLSEIKFGETPAIRLLSGEPSSLDSLALDSNTEPSERVAAIEALAVARTPTAAVTLETIVASGDNALFAPARAALRGVRRQANLIAPEYLPSPDDKNAHLAAIVFGKVDGQNLPQSNQGFYSQNRGGDQTPALMNYSFCKTLWNLEKPGKYVGRIAMFAPGPDYQKLDSVQFAFEAAGPNLFVVELKLEREVKPEVLLCELWLDEKMIERRILAENPASASALAARVPLQSLSKSNSADGDNEGNGRGPGALVSEVFTGSPTPVEAVPLFHSPAKSLPPVERATLEELVAHTPQAEQGKIPAELVNVARLEMGNPALTSESISSLLASLGDAAPALFLRLADEASPPTSLAAIDALHLLGEKSADACRKLIDLQKGPPDVQKHAEAAVNDLMTQGIIAQEGDNWRYHNQTHFPVKVKDPGK